jgi:CubicO group peptidase (beta-lactamase class C family)
MSKWKMRAVELLTGLAFTSKPNPAVIPYTPSKTEISRPEAKHFRRTTPERRGVSSKRIFNMLTSLENDPRAKVHNIFVLKDGEVICEASRPGYSVNVRHLSHSMSKTLTGMAIGILCSEGALSLDTRVADIFKEQKIFDRRFLNMTVRHLLTMSSGVGFSEAGSVTEYEWTKAFFDGRLSFAPGDNFAYNSMNSYILAKIVVRRTGLSLTDFINTRIFRPMGITNFFLEKGPEGVEKGGWGVHLSAESWAKLGVMMLSGGVFEGKRILPARWVAESTSSQIKVPEKTGDYNYGYHLWVHKTRDFFLFNGMLGQNVWVCPKNNIVAVVNCENNELFQKSAVIEILENYLGADMGVDRYDSAAVAALSQKERTFFESRRFATPKTPKKGLTYRLGLRTREPFDKAWGKILSTFTFQPNNFGFMPLIIRAMQNNYSGGIESVTFEKDGHNLVFISHEGGVDYKFNVGLYGFKANVINVEGEVYIVNAVGEATVDEDGNPSFKLELVLPEMPNSRYIVFTPQKDGKLLMKMTEMPNEKIAEPVIDAIYTMTPKLAFAANLLERRLGDRFIARKLESVFAPTLVGIDTKSEDYYSIVADERRRADEAQRSTKAISAMLLKLASDD